MGVKALVVSFVIVIKGNMHWAWRSQDTSVSSPIIIKVGALDLMFTRYKIDDSGN